MLNFCPPQSDVLSVTFSPFHPSLVFGGTYSGQILLWDTRAKQLPVLKSPLSISGHTYPVYDMQVVGTQNAHNLISTSTDGLVCSWLTDMLAQPQVSTKTSCGCSSGTDCARALHAPYTGVHRACEQRAQPDQ